MPKRNLDIDINIMLKLGQKWYYRVNLIHLRDLVAKHLAFCMYDVEVSVS